MCQNLRNADKVVYSNVLVYSVNVAVLPRSTENRDRDAERADRGHVRGPLTTARWNISAQNLLGHFPDSPNQRMIRRGHHRIVSEDHFHRDLDFSMLRSKLSHHSRNLLPDPSLVLFRNEPAVDKNLESIRNNIPLQPALRSIDIQSRSHLPSPPNRLCIDLRSSLPDLFSQFLQILNQRRTILDG